MNNALIAIGTRNRRLEKHAVAAARRIGPSWRPDTQIGGPLG